MPPYHLDGILNYCRTKVPLGVVEAVNPSRKHSYDAARGYKNPRYLLVKAQQNGTAQDRILVLRKAAEKACLVEFLLSAFKRNFGPASSHYQAACRTGDRAANGGPKRRSSQGLWADAGWSYDVPVHDFAPKVTGRLDAWLARRARFSQEFVKSEPALPSSAIVAKEDSTTL